ncbi:MAG: hypothetical protein LBO20_02185, partial [Bifidobacteriaceae bacterium]|nr:hypothetical protein [Bifidobacteriaceae bacterium]
MKTSHHVRRSTSGAVDRALKPLGPRRRVPKVRVKPPRAVAMAACGALALTGALVAGPLLVASPAQAIGYLGGWDGVFAPGQLWGAGLTPQRIDPADPEGAWRGAYDPGLESDGAACGSKWDSLALGPALTAQDDPRLAQIGWDAASGAAGLVFSGSGDCHRIEGFSAFAGYGGGAVNPVTGELYLVAKDPTVFDGDATTNQPDIKIAQVRQVGTPWAPVYRVYELAASSVLGRAPSAAALSAVAAGAGKAGDLGGDWRLSSDLAFDGAGRPHRLARLDQPGGAADVWALVRFQVLRNQGAASSTGWTYDVVRVFDDVEAADAVGLAFAADALYSVHADGVTLRWNPLTGAVEPFSAGQGLKDLAAADAPGVIEGVIAWDRTGVGSSFSDRIAGTPVEIWRETSGQRQLLGSQLSLTGSGGYWAAVPTSTEPYYVRARATLSTSTGPLPMAQTNASYRFAAEEHRATVNQVLPLCAGAEGDYLPQAQAGKCYGARADGLDPVQVADPKAAVGGAGAVTEVHLVDATEPAKADLWFTGRLSWGDAPDVYQTTNAALGPYAAPNALRLGTSATTKDDGLGCRQADCDQNDGGLNLAAVRADGAYDRTDWISGQGALLAAGASYRFRLNLQGDLAGRATGKLWAAPLVGGAASTTMSEKLVDGAPDADGYVYGESQIAAGPVDGGLALTFLRARASTDPGVTATSRGVAGRDADSGVVPGEIEDYAVAVADHVVRASANFVGASQPAYNFGAQLAFSNTLDQWPSVTGGRSTNISGNTGWVLPSTVQGAVADPSQPVEVATINVGTGSAGFGGWVLDPSQTVCLDQATGSSIEPGFSGQSLQLPAPGTGLGWTDARCDLVYTYAEADLTPTLEIYPKPDPANPVDVGLSSSNLYEYALYVH